ncbi:MAG: hypothetical protein WA116_08890 [Anaerolineaceae bacterium]
MKKVTLLAFLFFLLSCTACNSQRSATETPLTDETALPPASEPSPAQEKTLPEPSAIVPSPAEISNDPEEGSIPAAVSYIRKTQSGSEIASFSLNKGVEYASIPVEQRGATLRGPSALDSQNNLYISYGSKENYLSKLSLDGEIQTVKLPFSWYFQSLWYGDKLLVIPSSSTSEMYLIDTNLDIQVVSPALNAVPEGVVSFIPGTLGIANGSANLAIWTFTLPVRNTEGDFAHYRTYDLETGETTDEMVPIPLSIENMAHTDNPTDRLGTLVYGVDPANRNALLCYGTSEGDNSIFTTLELYNSSSREAIYQERRCCLNNVFDLRGDTFIEQGSAESCSALTVQNWSDMQPAFDYQPYLTKGSNNIVSNGLYWVIKTNAQVFIFNKDKRLEASYNLPPELLPDTLPNDLVYGSTLVVGLFMGY